VLYSVPRMADSRFPPFSDPHGPAAPLHLPPFLIAAGGLLLLLFVTSVLFDLWGYSIFLSTRATPALSSFLNTQVVPPPSSSSDDPGNGAAAALRFPETWFQGTAASAMARDQRGNYHLVYIHPEAEGFGLSYVRSTGLSENHLLWTTRTLIDDSVTPPSDNRLSLAIDPQGNVHVAYLDR